ncbi:MAG: 50S ribosomal protein L15e [Thaumarchaeota archaeon]|nr:50S ribosomal protein L15e [Nitrososphaerota archaeon]
MYRYINEAWRKQWNDNAAQTRNRLVSWRRGPTIVREERPMRLDRARAVGYKAKQGFVAVRIRVSRGGMRRERPRSGRRPKHMGVLRIKSSVNTRIVAENRVAKRYPNLKALNSYVLYRDGKYAWYEVILVDPQHPAIQSDKDLRWLTASVAA